jgi:colicin import membrane protein
LEDRKERERLLAEAEKKRQEKLKKIRETQKQLEKLEQSSSLTEKQSQDALQKQQSETRRLQAAMQDEIDKYSNQIKDKVLKNWAYSTDRSGLRVVYELVLSSSGTVVDLELIDSSGNPAYDESVKKAILIASPLPVPKEQPFFERTFGRGVSIEFKF